MQSKQKKDDKSSQQSTKKRKHSQNLVKKNVKDKDPPVQKLSRTEEIRKSSRQTDSVQNEKLKKFKYDSNQHQSKSISQQDKALKHIQDKNQAEWQEAQAELKDNENKRLYPENAKSTDQIKKIIDIKQKSPSASSSTKQSDDPKRLDDKGRVVSKNLIQNNQEQKEKLRGQWEKKQETKYFKLMLPIKYEGAGEGEVPGKVVKYLWLTNNFYNDLKKGQQPQVQKEQRRRISIRKGIQKEGQFIRQV